MSDTVKFTEEELASIKNIQQEYQGIVVQLGQLALERIVTENKFDELGRLESKAKSDLVEVQKKEKVLVDGLNTKYGVGTLNPQTGEFTPTPVQS